MLGGSRVEISVCVDVCEGFTMHWVAAKNGTVELMLTGDSELVLTFSERAFRQFAQQWPTVVAEVESR